MKASTFLIWASLIWLLWPSPASALDHDNLDPNRPVQMEDAYAIPKGELGVEGGVRVNDRRAGRTSTIFQPQLIYGVFDNTQLEIQGDFLPSQPRWSARTNREISMSACSIISIPKR